MALDSQKEKKVKIQISLLRGNHEEFMSCNCHLIDFVGELEVEKSFYVCHKMWYNHAPMS